MLFATAALMPSQLSQEGWSAALERILSISSQHTQWSVDDVADVRQWQTEKSRALVTACIVLSYEANTFCWFWRLVSLNSSVWDHAVLLLL